MSIEVKPYAPALPPTTAIEDPATRRFADSVKQLVQTLESPEHLARTLTLVLDEAVRSAPGSRTPGAAGAAGIPPGLLNDVLRSALWRALGKAVEQIKPPREVLDRIAKLEAGLTYESEVREEQGSMTITQLEAAVARAAQAEAAIYEESLVRASTDEATTQQLEAAVSRIGAAEAGIVEEKTTRATNDTAIVSAINTMWAMTGATQALVQNGSYVQTNWNAAHANWWNTLQAEVFGSGGGTIRQSLAQEAELRSNADGSLFAQYTVKIDQNGYVSGFGLASTANNGTPFSEFIVRADRFAIGSPGVADRVPFIVLTSADAAGNLPGVYMDDVFIKNASIGNAKIKRAGIDKLSVNTLDIQGNAVTVPAYASGVFSAAATIVLDQPGWVMAFASFTQGDGKNGDVWRLRIGGAEVQAEKPTVNTTGALSGARYLGAGVHQVLVQCDSFAGDGRCGVVAMGAKR